MEHLYYALIGTQTKKKQKTEFEDEKIQVSVLYLGKTDEGINVRTTTSGGRLKFILANRYKIKTSDIVLIFDEQVIEDTDELGQFGIVNGSVIRLVNRKDLVRDGLKQLQALTIKPDAFALFLMRISPKDVKRMLKVAKKDGKWPEVLEMWVFLLKSINARAVSFRQAYGTKWLDELRDLPSGELFYIIGDTFDSGKRMPNWFSFTAYLDFIGKHPYLMHLLLKYSGRLDIHDRHVKMFTQNPRIGDVILTRFIGNNIAYLNLSFGLEFVKYCRYFPEATQSFPITTDLISTIESWDCFKDRLNAESTREFLWKALIREKYNLAIHIIQHITDEQIHTFINESRNIRLPQSVAMLLAQRLDPAQVELEYQFHIYLYAEVKLDFIRDHIGFLRISGISHVSPRMAKYLAQFFTDMRAVAAIFRHHLNGHDFTDAAITFLNELPQDIKYDPRNSTQVALMILAGRPVGLNLLPNHDDNVIDAIIYKQNISLFKQVVDEIKKESVNNIFNDIWKHNASRLLLVLLENTQRTFFISVNQLLRSWNCAEVAFKHFDRFIVKSDLDYLYKLFSEYEDTYLFEFTLLAKRYKISFGRLPSFDRFDQLSLTAFELIMETYIMNTETKLNLINIMTRKALNSRDEKLRQDVLKMVEKLLKK